MIWRHRREARFGPSVLVLVLALGALITVGAAAPRADAYPSSVHGAIAACEICHTDNHTNWVVASEKCLTCHTPGHDASGWRNEAACTAACHLADGAVVRHEAHATGVSACTQCHALPPSVSDPGSSPHHTEPAPPLPAVAGFAPASGGTGTAVTVTGTGFRRTTSVTFGGVPASVFRVVSSSEIAAFVPVGALGGPVAVTTRGGTGTSTAVFTVPGVVRPALTVSAAPATLRRGAQVHIAGALTPSSLAGVRVGITVQRRVGMSWTAAGSAAVTAATDRTFAWTWRPPRTGTYRVRAVVPATAGHTSATSGWDAFRGR
jgi:hypothetical protein